MAYFAIYKRIKCRNWRPFDIIGWYSHQLNLEWYNSLTPEEQEYLKQKKKKDFYEFKKLFCFMTVFTNSYNEMWR